MVVAPLLILGMWGVAYVRACLYALEAPGVPFQFTYQSRSGDLTIAAESYSVSPLRGSVRLVKPRVLDRFGNVIVQLDNLEGTGLSFTKGGSQILRVHGRNLTGRLTRLRSGQIDLFDYLPQNTSGASATPYDVEIDRCKVEVVDLAGVRPWSRTVTSPQVKVVGVGKDWLATATASVSDIGSVTARLQNVTDEGLTLSGTSQSLQFAGLFAHILDTNSSARISRLRRASCESLVVSGPFKILVPVGKAPRLEATVDVTAKEVHYEKYSAHHASFVGVISAAGMTGSAELVDGSSRATFNGSAVWEGNPILAGDLTVSSPDSSTLPIWASALMPAASSFEGGSFHGWISVKSGGSYHLSGNVEALSAAASKQRFDNVRVGVDVEDGRAVLQVKRAITAGGPVSGVLTVDESEKTVSGYLVGQNLDLQEVGSPFGYRQVIGQASVSAVVTGSFKNPEVQFEAHGQGVVTPLKDHAFSLGNFEAAGTYRAGSVRVDQAYFNTAYGLISAQGAFGTSGNLGIELTGRGLQLAEYDPKLSGTANLRARISGTFRNPMATGRIEGSDLAYQSNSVQAVVANFKVDRNHAEITGFEAARGTAGLSGQGQIQFKSGRLDGVLKISDLQVAEWLSDDVVGAVDLPEIVVSGVVSHPIASGRVQGSSLVARGVKLDNLSADVKLDGNEIIVDGISLEGAGGSVTGSAEYDLGTRNGGVEIQAINLDLGQLSLDRFLPSQARSIAVGGAVSGGVRISVAAGNLVDVAASGTAKSFGLNATKVGDGNWEAAWANRVFTGKLDFGAKDKYVRLSDIVYDPDSQRLAGQLSLSDFEIQDLIEKALPSFPDLSVDVKGGLLALQGRLDCACSFDGTTSNPAVKVSDLKITGLLYHQEAVGDINARFEVSDRKWTIGGVTVSNGPALVALKGTVDERGELHIDASKDNRFDLARMAKWDPRLSRLTGTAHLWLSADGPSTKPRIVASLNVDNLFAPPEMTLPAEADDRYLRFEFDDVKIDPGSKTAPGISLNGAYFYKGFKGAISGSAPFEYPFDFPSDKPMNGSISLEKSNLKDIASLVEGLDPTKTTGSVQGSIKIAGTAGDLAISGGLDLEAPAIAFSTGSNELQNVNASLVLKAGTLQFEGHGQSGKGQLDVSASVPVERFAKLTETLEANGLPGLLNRPLSGSIKAKSVAFHEKIAEQSSAAGLASSDLKLEGTLQKPVVKGEISIQAGDVVFNGFSGALPSREDFPINPTFDIILKLSDTARLRSSTADMMLAGDGTLKGTLSNPKLSALVTVDKGSVRLPATLLRLQQGGSVQIDYGIQSKDVASVVVDLEGNTSVTASRYGDIDVQRYDITLLMEGDLLQKDGLNLIASSDPPDLTQDRILGILGETDVLQNLSSAGKENEAVQAALLSAVPSLLDPYTRQLAAGLGLDYLNLEYNAFDQASVTFGKILGSGFSIEGNRQLSEPPPGFPFRYDLRIVYHPRRLRGVFNQFRFYFGADQDNPWKLGVEYAVRF